MIIMLSIYPACFYKEKRGDYSVIFPKLGIATCGDTFEEAVTMAVDCLAGYLYDLHLEGKEFPAPLNVQEIDIDECYAEYETAFVNVITVDVEEYAKKHFEKSVKKTLTIPAWLNDLATQQHINFSATLQEALKKKLNVH